MHVQLWKKMKSYCNVLVLQGHNDNEYSWTEDCFEEGPSAYWYQTIFNEESWGAADDMETETRWLGDQSILNYSLGILDAVDENDEDYKFFLAVGFRYLI